MGFLFVDRITALDADHASGTLCPPDAPVAVPVWLVVEAVGQLAGWIAAARMDFAKRPVAALVGAIEISDVPAIGPVTLEARIDRVDHRAILFSGRAQASGGELVTLSRSVGPLLPMEAFDDPATVRARFGVLRGARGSGTVLHASDLAPPDLTEVTTEPGTAHASLQVPERAAFFADHFPRRQVYPATLLAAAHAELATRLAAAELGVAAGDVAAWRVADFKVRSFSSPGQRLVLRAESGSPHAAGLSVTVCSEADGARVSSCVLECRVRQRPR